MASQARPELSEGLRAAIDFGPLAVFFLVNFLPFGDDLQRAMNATSAFMLAMAAAMAVSYWRTLRISPMLWISGVLVLVFGSLTIAFHNRDFIQIKPSLVYAMLAIVLAYGLLSGRPLLQSLLGTAYPGLSARGWRLLTISWTGYFAAMVIGNELVRAYFTWDQWLIYKFPIVPIVTLVFAALNVPMLMRNGLDLDGSQDAPVPPEG